MSKLSIRPVPGKGLGVFAAAPLMAGEVLEKAPALELDAHTVDTIAQTSLDDYHFAHPGDAKGGLLVLGLSTLVNHADSPNTQTAAAFERRIGWTVTLRATQAIPAGTELTRRYACPVWFDPI